MGTVLFEMEGEPGLAGGLVSYLSPLMDPDATEETPPFEAECNALSAQAEEDDGNHKALLSKLIAAIAEITPKAADQDLENAYAIVIYLMRSWMPEEAPETIPDLVCGMSTAVASNTEDRPELRLRILMSLYNSMDIHLPTRYKVMLQIIKFCAATQLYEVMVSNTPNLEMWVQNWGVSKEEEHELYVLWYDALSKVSDSEKSRGYLIKYLQLFDDRDTSPVKDTAADLVVSTIMNPDILSFDDVLNLQSVKNLEKDADHSKLFALLKIFVSEKLDAYTAYHKTNASYMQSKGMDHEACTKKMRLLSLASIASEVSELDFELVAKTLNVKDEEVEGWVIAAISAKLMEAKMNQLTRKIVVSKCTQRSFGKSQWKSLHAGVNDWRDNIRGLLEIMAQAKPVPM